MCEHISREHLIEIFRILSNLEYQQQVWGRNADLGEAVASFDIAMHFLLDDTQLAENPSVEIGYLLKNPTEAKLVQSVTQTILELFQQIGGTLAPYMYIENPKWAKVVKGAEDACSIFK